MTNHCLTVATQWLTPFLEDSELSPAQHCFKATEGVYNQVFQAVVQANTGEKLKRATDTSSGQQTNLMTCAAFNLMERQDQLTSWAP